MSLFKPRIVIGTRGSALALKQTELVRQALLGVDNTLSVDVKIIATQGDTDARPIPLDVVGKGWFSMEIERCLQTGEIDLAVHSLKDLPEKLAEGLVIGAVTEREDARDVLVLKRHKNLKELPNGAVIGTDSIRRKVQLLALRPDIKVESMRGNVPTRLEKLLASDSHYDGIMLAAAGLHRLGLAKEITEYVDIEVVAPAPGQGALAVELMASNKKLAALVARINHAATDREVRAERAFSMAVGGGCKKPVGAYAISKKDSSGKETLRLMGMIGTSAIVRGDITGSFNEAQEIGIKLARRLLAEVDAAKGTAAQNAQQ
jgi:hydroxymethylbilane synthase